VTTLRVSLGAAVLALSTVPVGPALAGFSGSDVFLPMAGRQAGVHPSNWYTTVWVHNPGTEVATARIYFLERNTANPTPPWIDVPIAPGDTEKLENIVEALFHLEAFGALRVTCATQKLVVTSRVYSKAVGAGEAESVGQDFAGVPATFAIGAGEKSQILGTYQTLPAADSEYRYNFGFVETTGHAAAVRVRAYGGNGEDKGFKDFNVREWSQRQVGFKEHFPTVSTENVRLEVEVLSGTGRVIAYGSGIANGSQDPTTFEMEYKDSLLGIAGVQHDATLVGDGTAGTPLGLADGAVSTAKIAPLAVTFEKLDDAAVATDKIRDGAVTTSKLNALGAVAQQVLRYDGAAVGWGDDSLSLPYVGSGNTSGTVALFALANTGTGFGIEASTASQELVGRLVGDATGVYGHTMRCGGDYRGVLGLSTCTGAYGELGRPGVGVRGDGYAYGVHGSSASGDGVFGEAWADDKSGVFAVNDNPAGWAGFFRGRVGITAALECTGCVSKNGLSAPGGTDGQVLATDGSTLTWHDDGLSLPFDKSGSGGFLLRLTNSTGPRAIVAHGQGNDLTAAPLSGINSGSGAGAYGSSQNFGVVGEASQTYGIGVYGRVAGGLGGLRNSYPVGVYGDSGGVGVGVLGSSPVRGVSGISDSGQGVSGQTSTGVAVHGRSWGSGTAIEGESMFGGIGVRAVSAGHDAVRGESSGAGKSGVYGVNSDSGGFGVFGRNSASGYMGSLGSGAYAGDFGGPLRVSDLAGGGDVYADANGVLTLGGSSDARLKTAVVDLKEEVDIAAVLAGLRGVAFNWDISVERANTMGDRREIGLIAQEVEAVLPHVVGETPDGYKTLDYAKLTALLIEVAKAQQAELASQREVIDELRARVERLEASR
jgi:hypothetical protein